MQAAMQLICDHLAQQAPLVDFSRGAHRKAAFVLGGDVVILERGVQDAEDLEVNLLRAAAVVRNDLEVDVEVALSYPNHADLEFALVKSATTSEATEAPSSEAARRQ